MPTRPPRPARAIASGRPTWPQPPITTTSRSKGLPGDHSVTDSPPCICNWARGRPAGANVLADGVATALAGPCRLGPVHTDTGGPVIEPESGVRQIADYARGPVPDEHPANIRPAGGLPRGGEQPPVAGGTGKPFGDPGGLPLHGKQPGVERVPPDGRQRGGRYPG